METIELMSAQGGYFADIVARLNRCDNGEGMGARTSKSPCHLHARECDRFCDTLLVGRAEPDSEIDRGWIDAGVALRVGAANRPAFGVTATDYCYPISGISNSDRLWNV